MAFWLLCNSYLTKISLSVVITFMAPSPCSYDDSFSRCISAHHNCTSHDNLFQWVQPMQGVILGSFFVGYALTYMSGALAAKKCGCKRLLLVSVFVVCILDLAIPTFVFYGRELALILFRFLQGIADGVSFPTISVMMNNWIPTNERRICRSWMFRGAIVGTVMGNGLTGIVIGLTDRWDLPFYINGSLSLVWLLLWKFFVYDSVYTHPYIDEGEKQYIIAACDEKITAPMPWKAVIVSGPLWALIFAQIGFSWASYLMMTILPKYFTDILKLPVIIAGPLAAIPWIAMSINISISRVIIEYAIRKRLLTRNYARKISCAIAFSVPAVFFLIASYLECDKVLVIICFTIAIAMMAPYYAGIKINPLDLSPNYAGNIICFVNGIGAIVGMLPPICVGIMTPHVSIEEYRQVFWITFIIYQATAALYMILASAEVQWWDEWDLSLMDKSYMNISKNMSTVSYKIDPNLPASSTSRERNI